MHPARPFLTARRIAAFSTIAFVSGCGSGCGNCTVPPYTAGATPLPGATPSPKPTPLPPGVTPTPVAAPTVPGATPTPQPPGVTPTPTPAPPPPAPPPPTPTPLACSTSTVLGPALAPFAILAGSTVTNVGNTIVSYAAGAVTNGVNDDLIGVSPGTAVTGFYPPGLDSDGVNAIYAAGYNPNATVPLNAQNGLTTAYNTLAGTPANQTLAAPGELSTFSVPGYPAGTLPPGVYKSPSSLQIQSGNLTLDGLNNPRSVFIFEAGSTLTTTLNGTASGNINLINGADACNIYWQVGSSATLDGAAFSGNVLANASVTISARTFNGRALARIGAVSITSAAGSLITNPGGQ